MGHRVSTPRHHGARTRGGNIHSSNGSAIAATSLTILLAVMASTGSSSSSSSSTTVSAGRPPSSPRCCGCFVSRQPSVSAVRTIPPSSASGSISSTSSTSSTSTSLHAAAYSSIIAVAAATVPPPNSRLGLRLHHQQSPSSHHQRHRQSVPGTMHSRGGSGGKHKNVRRSRLQRGGLTDLRYATYGDDSDETIGESSSSSPWKGFSSKANAAKDDDDDGNGRPDATAEESAAVRSPIAATPNNRTRHRANRDDDGDRHAIITSIKRKRARMLRFLDRRLARLQPKSAGFDDDDDNAKRGNSESDKRRLEYEQRKAAWAAKYTSVSTLRKSFGTNKNRIWGDFDPTSTRRLYHTLLPRALLELRGLRDGLLSNVDGAEESNADGRGKDLIPPQQLGVLSSRNSFVNGNATTTKNKNDNSKPESSSSDDDESSYLQQELKELAPLAYQARLAAKKYARERSRLPGRIGSMLYDGYRSWRQYGKWTTSGMTWEQVWNKYEDQVLKEQAEAAAKHLEEWEESLDRTKTGGGSVVVGGEGSGMLAGGDDLDDDELTARICLRILERSVVTNEAIDRLFLKQLVEEDAEDDAAATAAAVEGRDVVMEESQQRHRQRRRRVQRQRRHKLRIQADLAAIEKKFDDDIQELLQYSYLTTKVGDERRSKRQSLWQKLSGGSGPIAEEEDGMGGDGAVGLPGMETPVAAAFARGGDGDEGAQTLVDSINSNDKAESEQGVDDPKSSPSLRRLAVHEVFALRILATTKQRIELLQSLPSLVLNDGEAEDNDDESESVDRSEFKTDDGI